MVRSTSDGSTATGRTVMTSRSEAPTTRGASPTRSTSQPRGARSLPFPAPARPRTPGGFSTTQRTKAFDQPALDIDAESRTESAVPGLRYLADWLNADASRALLQRVDSEPWSAQLRRRVQHYGHRYDYGRRAVAADPQSSAPPLPGWAEELSIRLVGEGLMDQVAEQVIVNEYQPGQGISAHVDCVPCFGPVVAAVSLGSWCLMDFTNPADGTKVAVPIAPGSLLLMTGPARYTWRHAIAARKSDPGPMGRMLRVRRVSVTFRTVLHPGE
ncbi:alpha-ketoglutarate-dependent dioxygenase AlkB [Catellatospora aurea]|uniref:Alpha-ketoglutarate-dependent dioxygenase AlkB n=1 Tax=Catellatospora aurea TaxID=1337874 RepID=A0ABW2H6X3_9ACTN